MQVAIASSDAIHRLSSLDVTFLNGKCVIITKTATCAYYSPQTPSAPLAIITAIDKAQMSPFRLNTDVKGLR
jgi:hypothetical protein